MECYTNHGVPPGPHHKYIPITFFQTQHLRIWAAHNHYLYPHTNDSTHSKCCPTATRAQVPAWTSIVALRPLPVQTTHYARRPSERVQPERKCSSEASSSVEADGFPVLCHIARVVRRSNKRERESLWTPRRRSLVICICSSHRRHIWHHPRHS